MNAKDLLSLRRKVTLKEKLRVLLNTMVTLRLGLMLVTQLEMFLLRLTQVVPEHGKLDKMDPSQELE